MSLESNKIIKNLREAKNVLSQGIHYTASDQYKALRSLKAIDEALDHIEFLNKELHESEEEAMQLELENNILETELEAAKVDSINDKHREDIKAQHDARQKAKVDKHDKEIETRHDARRNGLS